MELLARDIASVRVRDFIRQEIRAVLLEAGIPLPTQPPKPKRRGAHLRLIDEDK